MTSTYQNPLHDGTNTTFDAYELQEVGEYVDEQGRAYVEPIFSKKAEPMKRFWTIYGHTQGEGVMALVDVDKEENALDILRRMGVLK